MSLITSILNLIKFDSMNARITILSPMKKEVDRKLLARKAYIKFALNYL